MWTVETKRCLIMFTSNAQSDWETLCCFTALMCKCVCCFLKHDGHFLPPVTSSSNTTVSELYPVEHEPYLHFKLAVIWL